MTQDTLLTQLQDFIEYQKHKGKSKQVQRIALYTIIDTLLNSIYETTTEDIKK